MFRLPVHVYGSSDTTACVDDLLDALMHPLKDGLAILNNFIAYFTTIFTSALQRGT